MSIVRRKGKTGTRYGVVVWSQGRSQWVGTFPTLADAKHAEATYRAPSGTTYGDFATRWLTTRTHARRNTTDNYGFLLTLTTDSLGGFELETVTAADVERTVAALSTRYAPLTVRTAIDTMRQVYKAAMRDGLAHSDPTRNLTNLPKRRAAREIRALTREEHARIVAACPTHYRPMLALWPLVGLRRGEMLGLRWSDVGDVLTIRQQYTHGRITALKTDSSRRDVPLNAQARDILDAWREVAPYSRDGLVFCTEQGSPVHSDAFTAMWSDATAGLDVTSHVMRHTFATWLLLNGVGAQVVAQLLGHANPAITLKTYAHLLPSSGSDAVGGLSISLASDDERAGESVA